jgi:NADPH:quinone reductase-like Zn-dependent oxidoreductase
LHARNRFKTNGRRRSTVRAWHDSTMKAAYIERFGGPEVIKYGDLPDPKPDPGEVVVDVAAASAANQDYVRGLGADEILDYNKQDFTKAVRDCDAVLDTVGGEIAQRSFAVLRPGGRAAFIASGPQAPKPERADVTALRPNVRRTRAHLERIARLVESGAVRVPEIKVYRLGEAADAHRVSEARHFRGKLVLQVR